jgi:hypothetical protein
VTDNFDALYAALKPKGVTVSAMLAKAVAETLKKHPIVNAAYVEGGIKYNKGTSSTSSQSLTPVLVPDPISTPTPADPLFNPDPDPSPCSYPLHKFV